MSILPLLSSLLVVIIRDVCRSKLPLILSPSLPPPLAAKRKRKATRSGKAESMSIGEVRRPFFLVLIVSLPRFPPSRLTTSRLNGAAASSSSSFRLGAPWWR